MNASNLKTPTNASELNQLNILKLLNNLNNLKLAFWQDISIIQTFITQTMQEQKGKFII